ncbi:MAG: primosome assembly protein PriA [Sphingobium sp. 32-64-5]|nr:MAG: primosome assembly protein PriA [Sphingobium sp. 32-64-5]
MADRDLERRRFAEIRTAGKRLEGYACLFAAEARIGDFVETVAPGAFRESLSGDVLALQDHAFDKVLGRTQSGTLRLSEDTKGLAFSLDLPDTTPGRDVLALATRGDLGGMSFGFQLPAGGDTWDGNRRTLRSVKLLEISVVSAWPAYPDTAAELALRSRHQGTDAQRRRRSMVLARTRWI